MVSQTYSGDRRLWYPSGPRVDSNGNRIISQSDVGTSIIRDPSPTNWKVLKAHEENNWLIIRLKYEGCTNYEGEKILVYKNMTLIKLINNKSIDPHFLKHGISPTARFVPTHEGWNLALLLVRAQK